MYIIARIFNLLWQCLLQFCHTRLLVNSCTSSHFSPYPIPTFEFSRTKCSAEIQTESMPLRTLNRGGVGLWKIHDRSIPCRWCYRPRNFIEFGTKLSDILLGKFAISVSWFWSWSWWKVNLFVPFLKISSTAVLFGVILCPHKQTESKHCTTSFLCFALNEYAADCRSIAFVTCLWQVHSRVTHQSATLSQWRPTTGGERSSRATCRLTCARRSSSPCSSRTSAIVRPVETSNTWRWMPTTTPRLLSLSKIAQVDSLQTPCSVWFSC